jgi:hypothetical protein
MSKSSDYARAIAPLLTELEVVRGRMEATRKLFEPSRFQVDSSAHGCFFAYLSDNGGLHCHAGGLSGEDALRFGQWILEVFGEEVAP